MSKNTGLSANASSGLTSTDSGFASGKAADGTVDLSRDTLFETLSNQRRRYTLHHLEQSGGTADLGSLSEQVAAWENDKSLDAVSASERKNVYTSLQQFHLPKLDDIDLVEFDDRQGVVGLGPAAGELDLYLEVVESGSVPWSVYYAGIAGIQGLALAAAQLGILSLSTVELGTLFVTMLAVSAIAHTYYTKREMRLGACEEPPEAGL